MAAFGLSAVSRRVMVRFRPIRLFRVASSSSSSLSSSDESDESGTAGCGLTCGRGDGVPRSSVEGGRRAVTVGDATGEPVLLRACASRNAATDIRCDESLSVLSILGRGRAGGANVGGSGSSNDDGRGGRSSECLDFLAQLNRLAFLDPVPGRVGVLS